MANRDPQPATPMPLTLDPLSRQPGVRHGFFTRQGGVSEGIFASLNCGFGSADVQSAVSENRRRAMDRFESAPESLVTLHQVHSPDAVAVERPWAVGASPKADAMVTQRPGVVLGILTADCAPVLFADAEAGVIGAAHAGWKGALTGVLEATLAEMVSLGAQLERIVAGIGPCIAQSSYEVGPEFRERFLAADKSSEACFVQSGETGRPHFDLQSYAVRRLRAAGVGEVATLPRDTCAEETQFFSYRRACHRGETDYGRGLSAIRLDP